VSDTNGFGERLDQSEDRIKSSSAMPGGLLISKPTCRNAYGLPGTSAFFVSCCQAATLQEIAMRWVTLLSTDNVEHTINMEAVVQVVGQSDGVRQVHLIGGETLLISAQEWTTKMHEQIQRSRGVS